MGKEMTVGAAALRSYVSFSNGHDDSKHKAFPYLFQQIRRKHKHFCVGSKGLDSSKIANSLLVVFRGRHDFKDVEGRPGHVMAKHFEVYQLQ